VSQDERDAFEGRIAALEAALAERDAFESRIAALEAALAERDALIAELKAQLDRNSTNSNLPPSSDGPGAAARGMRPGKDKTKGKRKRGGQKGHKGHKRELLPEGRIHEIVNLFPPACERCAASLGGRSDGIAKRYQQAELDHEGLHITEWRRHETVCDGCGHRTIAAYDGAQIPSSAFGPGLIARIATLTGVYRISRRNTQRLLSEWFDLHVSLGSISTMEVTASEALKAADQEALDDVQAAEVKHTDGTTWLLAGLTHSLWTMATRMTTVYRIFKDGKRKTIREMFGELFGILVSDRTQVLTFWEMARRQICWSHLLRKFVAFSQRAGPAGRYGRELLDYAALAFEYWHGFENGQLTRAELQEWMQPLQQRFEAALERAAASGIRGLSGSCRDLLAHKEALWTFVSHEGVPPTNNLAERDLRPLVIWRKLSFGCQSERGLRFVERVMTVAHTARKRGKNVLDFIVRSVTAHLEGAQAPALLAA